MRKSALFTTGGLVLSVVIFLADMTKAQYESETANLYAKDSTYRDHVEQLIKKVNNHA